MGVIQSVCGGSASVCLFWGLGDVGIGCGVVSCLCAGWWCRGGLGGGVHTLRVVRRLPVDVLVEIHQKLRVIFRGLQVFAVLSVKRACDISSRVVMCPCVIRIYFPPRKDGGNKALPRSDERVSVIVKLVFL